MSHVFYVSHFLAKFGMAMGQEMIFAWQWLYEASEAGNRRVQNPMRNEERPGTRVPGLR